MNKRVPILMGLFLLALGLWFQTTQVSEIRLIFSRLDHIFYDLQVRTSILSKKKKTISPIVIVDIDEASLLKEGQWPWQRWKLAKLIDKLRQAGAVVIALDITFSEPEENIATEIGNKSLNLNLTTPEITEFIKKIQPYFDYDKIFADSLAKIDTVLGFTFTVNPQTTNPAPPPILTLKTEQEKALEFYVFSGIVGNIPILQNAAQHSGYINAFSDDDGILRRTPLLVRHADNLYPMLGLVVAQTYLLKPIELVIASYNNQNKLEGIKFNEYVIPTDEKAQVILPFQNPRNTFPYVSATKVLHDSFPSNIFEGKIVFIGSTALGDYVSTPVRNYFPGVEIHANVVDGILSGGFSYRPAWVFGLEVSMTFLISIILILACPYLSARILIFLMLTIIPALIIINSWVLNNTSLIISMNMTILSSIAIILANILYNYLFESRRREHVLNIFNQYVPVKHINEMLKSYGNYGLQGENREMTVMFADIRNFTAISESLNAMELKELLNAYFTPMTEIIFHHRGTIDKYVGDLIMAFWGAPLKDRHHPRHAIQTALDMQKEIKRLKADFAEKKWPEIQIGIGINTGLMNVGDMGSKFRRNYTVLGDAVNTASRVESLTKFYGVGILVTEGTQKDQALFLFRKVDKVKAVGKEKPTEIYEPLCTVATASPELEKELTVYHGGLALYFEQQWNEAREVFTLLCEQYPKCKLYELYLQRILEFQINPPPPPWDGTFVHHRK